MSFWYPIPNKEQIARMAANGITLPRGEFFVSYADKEDGLFRLQNYKTGDEISYRPNPLKKHLKGGTDGRTII